MDALFVRWIGMLAVLGAGIGMIWGFLTYEDEPVATIIPFPAIHCDECAEYV